ncbi:unnamed protein product [Brassicogethes aeneus]|uniref:ZAD domain-containing protein n=1 Tax=Brassicogethes aeneus TaxID=1431903 RepID=A0A9P0FPW0_BRAAE|nr:unnamed protein product [Brassicogethes aeneus]
MMECIVPDCKNPAEITLTKDLETREKWMKEYQVENLSSDQDYWICKGHFVDESETVQNVMEPNIIEPNEVSTCRICNVNETAGVHMFNDEIDGEKIVNVANKCFYPFEIIEDEKSNYICLNCFGSLESYSRFKEMFYSKNCIKLEDLKIEKNDVVNSRKRRNVGDIEKQLEEMENGLQESDTDVDTDASYDSDMEYTIIRTNGNVEEEKMETKTDIDIKFEMVEEELRRVLEGQLSEEQIQAENIIIAVEADEDTNTTKTSITEMKLPIVIKPLGKYRSVVQGNKKIQPVSRKKQKISCREGQVTLPKGISVKLPEKYESDTGVFEAIPRIYIFQSEFCMVDDYLYEYRLCKGAFRYMRCLNQSCQSMAVQKKITSASFENYVSVEIAHNHAKPSEKEMKKLMFYNVMKRMVQNDKTMNFKSVYEEVCQDDPEIRTLVPLRNVINEICRHQLSQKPPKIFTFDQFYDTIEHDVFKKLHFTHSGKQFYQEKFESEDGDKAVVFANCDIVDEVCGSKLMYVDASFRIDSVDSFDYQLVTTLVWVESSYYPIMYALVSKNTQEIYKKVMEYLHDFLAPDLRPDEIVTDYESNLYYALGETYLDSHIGGSVFYYTQNLYKKICNLNLARDLESNSYFRNIYHMLLMLPLLPVNTIVDGLNNIEIQARDLGLSEVTTSLFEYVRSQWIAKVTPDLFCVHRLENRINENVIAPFKKLRDFLMLTKGKAAKDSNTIVGVVEKLIELESFLQQTYAAPNKRAFARDLSSSQKKNVLKAWQFIESHPKININHFFTKVLGYIKCMENQLWIWGFYRYKGEVVDDLINAANFLIVSNDVEESQKSVLEGDEGEYVEGGESVVMEAVIDENGGFVLQGEGAEQGPFENAFLKYVYEK